MVLCLSLTISVALFGLTSADPTAQELLRNHNSICDNGQVAGLIAECRDTDDPCWKWHPRFYDANEIKCYTPLQRKSFSSEAGRPRSCYSDKQVVAYAEDDFACVVVTGQNNVVGCDRPLYCIWAKAEDVDKWAHSPRKTTYIEDDYPVEVLDKPCNDDSQLPRYETGLCNYTDFTSSCDYGYKCERRNKNIIVSVVTVKNSPPSWLKCDPGFVPREVDTCSNLNRDPTTCREWKCLDGSTIPKAWSGSDKRDHSRKNMTGISYHM